MAVQQLAPPQRTTVYVDLKSGIPTHYLWNWLTLIYNILKPGLSVTITTAKLTAGGANGSMTFTNGVLTAQTPAT